MNKNNAKALSTLRQKIRKYNRDFESHITNYKQVRMLEIDFLNCGDSDPPKRDRRVFANGRGNWRRNQDT